MTPNPTHSLPRVCAVSYLNTVPLVWGFLRGPQREAVELMFRVPAECADMVAAGEADIGIVPAYELLRQRLETVQGVGIACRGAVRSILLVSKVAPEAIRTLAADVSSRSSVALARIILSRGFGAAPGVRACPPVLESMLGEADAALIIGDPALRLDAHALPYRVLDLGREWNEMTGLPMVFAVWAGPAPKVTPELAEAFQASCRFGLDHIEEIVRVESQARGFAPELVRAYLTRHIVHELGAAEYAGMELFLRYARELPDAAEAPAGLTRPRAV